MPRGHHADDGGSRSAIANHECVQADVATRCLRIVATEIDGQRRKKDHSPTSASISRSIVRLPRAMAHSTAPKMLTATAISAAT